MQIKDSRNFKETIMTSFTPLPNTIRLLEKIQKFQTVLSFPTMYTLVNHLKYKTNVAFQNRLLVKIVLLGKM